MIEFTDEGAGNIVGIRATGKPERGGLPGAFARRGPTLSSI
jgi:hypothetical protein